MRAGQLRHRVTIEQMTEAQDSYGGVTVTWSEVDTVWAAIEPITGREKFVGGGDVRFAENEVQIRMRYRSDVTPKMRLTDEGGTVYNIRAVIDRWGVKRELLLRCTVAE